MALEIPAEEIVDGFLADYLAAKAHRVRPKFIADYIRKCQRFGELGRLDGPACQQQDMAQRPRRSARTDRSHHPRPPINDPSDDRRALPIRRILSPTDEVIGSRPRQQSSGCTQLKAAAEAASRQERRNLSHGSANGSRRPALRHAAHARTRLSC